MAEVGVALGIHQTRHKIHILECGGIPVVTPDEDDQDFDPASVNINSPIGNTPYQIFEYMGFAASPHRVTFTKNGLALIPTDIGILQYDLIKKRVICEWLNPTLIPYITDKIRLSGDTNVTSIVSGDYGSFKGTKSGKKYMSTVITKKTTRNREDGYQVGLGTILKVSADDVYDRASNIGSYGQITYEKGDFAADLIVLLDRSN